MARSAFPRFLWLSLVLAALPAGAGAASGNASDTALETIVQQGEALPLAGLAAARLHDGRMVYSHYSGFRYRTDGHSLPVTPQTRFRIASVSKLVTTIGLMRLVEQGRVRLDDDASGYLGFALRNPDFPSAPITVRMLLNHTSSIRDADGYLIPPGQDIASLFDTAHPPGPTGDHFAHGAGRAPGAWFEYCNLCYGLVGTIIERVSGERFDRYMRAHVLDPAGIAGGYDPLALPDPDALATLYRHLPQGWVATADDRPLRGRTPAELAHYRVGSNGTLFSPQGGLRVSIPEMARIARLMMQRGTLDGVRILSPASVEMMERPTWTYDGHNGLSGADGEGPIDCYGLSVICLLGQRDAAGRGDTPYPGYRGGLRGHLGNAYGLHSGLWYDPKTGDALLFAATGYPSDPETRPGRYSYFTRVEEEILGVLARADSF
ncbi:serine hydrolase domain-containing protein [Gluconacetobacter tumulicola]|uniref:Beta-lactamase family protein n=1 Tax=Gluconacetobacter tumulicola TaxID=1017177 RepID=A0A7W4JF04_9PROT|nr:serine hydrolase domain-containing protein [Gluconacetobacter tumulicola]MBB2180061.1 beta-lactamase family protein [Gluconacetobacter tumulicola]